MSISLFSSDIQWIIFFIKVCFLQCRAESVPTSEVRIVNVTVIARPAEHTGRWVLIAISEERSCRVHHEKCMGFIFEHILHFRASSYLASQGSIMSFASLCVCVCGNCNWRVTSAFYITVFISPVQMVERCTFLLLTLRNIAALESLKVITHLSHQHHRGLGKYKSAKEVQRCRRLSLYCH